MQQQEGLKTLRQLNNGKAVEVDHQLSGQIEFKKVNKPQQKLLSGKLVEQKDHGDSCGHDHGGKGHGHNHGSQGHGHQGHGHEGHNHGKGGKHGHGKQNKNYCIMGYTIFTCLSCLYLQTQHLNPYRGDHFAQIMTYITWFDVIMCLWSYIQTFRISNKVHKLSKLLNVDTVQNKVVDPKYLLTARHCQKCNFYKLPRVSHCSTCGQCIYKLDHHCMWTQTCIGHCNQRPFILFCFYMAVGVFQFWVATIRTGSVMMASGGCNSNSVGGFFSVFQPGIYILWVITCLSAGVVGMMIVGLAISHGMMICTNFTTLDSMKKKMMPPFPFIQFRSNYFETRNINTFDRGQIQNLRSLFGTNVLTFWLPFGRQIQNEFIIEPMNPQPTKLQLMKLTTLYDQELNLQKQVERLIPQVKQLYKGKKIVLDGNQITI